MRLVVPLCGVSVDSAAVFANRAAADKKKQADGTHFRDAETAAWNARDADALASLFHPDTVWPWPPTLRVVVSEQGDGAFAVVDVDTLWRHRISHDPFHWKGRACKVYLSIGTRNCASESATTQATPVRARFKAFSVQFI